MSIKMSGDRAIAFGNMFSKLLLAPYGPTWTFNFKLVMQLQPALVCRWFGLFVDVLFKRASMRAVSAVGHSDPKNRLLH